MPSLYLSPSTQEYNPYVTTGTEEYWMNRLADAMEPYLNASGIQYDRNTPDMTAASSIAASNRGSYQLHLALHSNASPEERVGSQRGILALYFPSSVEGKRAAELLANGLKAVYPLPNLVRAEPSSSIGELRRTRAPSVLLELGYHDNAADADWIIRSIDAIAGNLVLSLTEFFGIPFFSFGLWTPGQVRLSGGVLNVYPIPSVQSAPVAQLTDGAPVTVVNAYDSWYLIRFGDAFGYAAGAYIET